MARLVIAETYSDAIAAYLARGHLEAEGIPAIVHDEHHISANWLVSHAIGGVKVKVAKSNLKAAKNILHKHAAGEYDLDPNLSYSDGLSCPKCDSDKITSRKPWLMIILGILTFGVYSLIMAKSRIHHWCGNCNYDWHLWFE